MRNDYDIIVVGGGISGLGVAKQASTWGFSVLLLEASSIGNATSKNSLRIMHGGLRYLQSLNIPRVRESIVAQGNLLKSFPELVEKLPCIMPLERCGFKSRIPLAIALRFYQALRKYYLGNDCGESGQILNNIEAKKLAPIISNLFSHGALFWFDAILNDPSILYAKLVSQIKSNGGEVIEFAKVSSYTHNVANSRTNLSFDYQGNKITCNAKVVVNCSGPWINLINETKNSEVAWTENKWCKAFNLIIKQKLNSQVAFGVKSQGRLLFYAPRKDGAAIGTWYSPYDQDLSAVRVTQDEISAACNDFNQAIQTQIITPSDIIGVEVGVLPATDHVPTIPVGREKIIAKPGIVHVLSTKFTTFDEQAKRAMLALAKYLK